MLSHILLDWCLPYVQLVQSIQEPDLAFDHDRVISLSNISLMSSNFSKFPWTNFWAPPIVKVSECWHTVTREQWPVAGRSPVWDKLKLRMDSFCSSSNKSCKPLMWCIPILINLNSISGQQLDESIAILLHKIYCSQLKTSIPWPWAALQSIPSRQLSMSWKAYMKQSSACRSSQDYLSNIEGSTIHKMLQILCQAHKAWTYWTYHYYHGQDDCIS